VQPKLGHPSRRRPNETLGSEKRKWNFYPLLGTRFLPNAANNC
jgi:hypothetical protein